jgi:hypothetical protein
MSVVQRGVTYSEVRDWATWLQIFTVSDLADAMAVDDAVADRAVRALLWHGICEVNGLVDSRGERIVSYVPLPPGPREHYTEAPEWATCEQEILSPRGMPVRIRSDRDTRRKLAGDMSARHRLLLQEKRYQAMLDARKKRSEAAANREPKWLRKKRA